MFFDMLSQAQGVLTNQALRPVRIASLKCVSDIHVIDHRTLGSIIFLNRHIPDSAHMNEEIVLRISNDFAMTLLNYFLMKSDVGHGVFADMRRARFIVELLHDRVQSTDFLIGRPTCCEPGRHTF